MQAIIEGLKESYEKKLLVFPEPFFISKDENTYMGEISYDQILLLEYRDTEAGSNPREYSGLKTVNISILKSLLKENNNMFRFLHSGIIVCITNPKNIDDKTIKYDECCLTNGNQTRFIILMLTLLKLYFKDNQISTLSKKDFDFFIKTSFDKSNAIKTVLNYTKFKYINELTNFLISETKYGRVFNSMKLSDFLNSKIRIQINSINSIISELENSDLNEYGAGTLIAEANNATQNVKPDDLFGNKNKKELESFIFKDFNILYKGKVNIEYRYGEIMGKSSDEKVHILTLLRPIISTGILTKEKDIYKFTNQRAPIYSIFEKVIKKIQTNQKTVDAISKLIPLLYSIRTEYIIPTLEEYKRELIREYTKKAVGEELDETTIQQDILDEIRKAGPDDEKEKIIKRNVNYNIEHIMPVLVFRIRKLFKEDNQKATLSIDDTEKNKVLTKLIKAIYDSYVKMKLGGLPTSLTTTVRTSKFYDYGIETYNALKDDGCVETDFIEKNKHIII